MLRNSILIIFILLSAVVFKTGDLYAADKDIKLRTWTGHSYDDNITFTEKDRQADFITTLGLGADFNYALKRMSLGLSADVIQQLFWRYTGNHNTSQQAVMKLGYELSKHEYVTLSDSFSHSYEPSSFEEEFDRISGRYSYYRNRFDVAYGRHITEQFDIKVGYGYDLDRSSRSDLVDSDLNRFSLEAGYAFSSKTMVLGNYEFVIRDLDPGGEATVHTLNAGLRRFLTEQLSLETWAGVDIIDSYNGESIIEPRGTVTFKDQITEKTSVNGTFAQRYTTNAFTDDVFNSWKVSGGLDSQLSRRLGGMAEVFYGRGKYVSLDLKDDFLGGSVGLTYDICKNIRGYFSYTYSQTASNIGSREYRRNAVFLGVSTAF